MWRAIAVASFVCFTAATAAPVQDYGDAPRGLAFAQQVCSGCHALQKGEIHSPHPDAPTFPVIALVPGLTALALTVALQSSHARMPDLVLDMQERRDVIAYILSLRSTN